MSQPKRHDDEQALLAKIKSLPPERVAEVEDFVDFLRSRDEEQQLTRAASRLSEEAFARVWDRADALHPGETTARRGLAVRLWGMQRSSRFRSQPAP
jgi:hypothetical protein